MALVPYRLCKFQNHASVCDFLLSFFNLHSWTYFKAPQSVGQAFSPTLLDPAAHQGPWLRARALLQHPGFAVYETVCRITDGCESPVPVLSGAPSAGHTCGGCCCITSGLLLVGFDSVHHF